jgi:hypothetical protein
LKYTHAWTLLWFSTDWHCGFDLMSRAHVKDSRECRHVRDLLSPDFLGAFLLATGLWVTQVSPRNSRLLHSLLSKAVACACEAVSTPIMFTALSAVLVATPRARLPVYEARFLLMPATFPVLFAFCAQVSCMCAAGFACVGRLPPSKTHLSAHQAGESCSKGRCAGSNIHREYCHESCETGTARSDRQRQSGYTESPVQR